MCTCKKIYVIINSEVQVCAHKKCTNATYFENSQSLFTLAFEKKVTLLRQFFFFNIGMAPFYRKRKHFLVLLEVRLEESTRKAWRSNGVTFKVKIHVAERCFGFNLKGSDCTQQSEDSHVAMQLCPCLMQNWHPAGKVWDRFDSTKENPEKMNM